MLDETLKQKERAKTEKKAYENLDEEEEEKQHGSDENHSPGIYNEDNFNRLKLMGLLL